ncbi:HIR1 [Symbiodinium sp. KB8]|nr:HIR1 [Symbiodinium sp. KB8]
MWPVETYKQLKCRECSQHDQSQEDCLACAPKCDYGTKELSGIKITGCFNSENYAFDKKEAEKQAAERLKEATKDAPQGEAAVKQELQAYETKETPETESKRLSVIPHYRLWDPKAHDDFGDLKQPRPETGGYFQGEKLPWEGRDTFLSARAWVDRFPQAAPHIQHLLDKVYTLLATKGNLGAIPCDGTGTRNAGIGQLIIGTQTSQKACNEMQETDRFFALERFGKFDRTLAPGLSWAGFDLCGACVAFRSISSRVVQSFIRISTKTQDNVFVYVLVAVQHTVTAEGAQDALYKLEDVSEQLDSYVADVVRSFVPSQSLDECFERKEEISLAVEEKLKTEMVQFGLTILKALVTDIQPDHSVVASMNEINKQKRLRDASQMAAEANQFKVVRAAEASADAAQLAGEGIGIMFNIREGEDTWDYDYGYDEATANTVVLFLERIEKKVVLEAGK